MWRILFVVFMLSFVMPMISLLILRFSHYIKSIHLHERRERIVPFIFVMSFYAISSYLFYDKINLNDVLYLLFLAIAFLLVALTLLNLKVKVSIHSAAIWGVFGFIYTLGLKYPEHNIRELLTVLALIGGLVNTSRLALDAHTPIQVGLGGIAGFVVCFLSFYIYL
jgi:membrane-associated phospholipid phosphatase